MGYLVVIFFSEGEVREREREKESESEFMPLELGSKESKLRRIYRANKRTAFCLTKLSNYQKLF